MRVALLFLGSATLLFSCGEQTKSEVRKPEPTMMTEYSENLSIVMSQNGRRSYFFETPLLEGYTLAAEPYREFREGIKITTYQDDSLTTVNAVLTANYAIYYEERQLWEAKGNVEIHKHDGTEVYTQQLFWNARTKQIYSNVDTKLVRGNNVTVGERFESDEEFRDWRFRYQKSRMEVEMKEQGGDSTRREQPTPKAQPKKQPAAKEPMRRQTPPADLRLKEGDKPLRVQGRRKPRIENPEERRLQTTEKIQLQPLGTAEEPRRK